MTSVLYYTYNTEALLTTTNLFTLGHKQLVKFLALLSDDMGL